MKILSAPQTREADQYTIQNEPIASIDLMERASRAFTQKFCEHFTTPATVKVFAGIGNNGGDALCIARMLVEEGFSVKAYAIRFSDQSSDDFKANEQRLQQETSVTLENIFEDSPLPPIDDGEILIDGLFGSGLNRPVEGLPAKVIDHLNDNDAIRVAIDVPSGVFADKPSEGAAFEADLTITFQQPKLAFMMPENYPYVGEWVAVDIGLDQDFIEQLDCDYRVITMDDMSARWRFRSKFDYKNSYGHALIAAGGKGKVGASILAARACLFSGAGLVTAHVPGCAEIPIHSTLPEVMLSLDNDEREISNIDALASYNVIGVGPGIGTSEVTAECLRQLMQESKVPLVVDADALNILGQHLEWMEYLPSNSILTPHPGELHRIVGHANNSFEELEMARKLAQKHHITVIIKRAHSAVCWADGTVWFNDTGNPGMGTAGSGDVLTGIITGLVAQQYYPEEAAIIGVTVHGMAGDEAAFELSEQGLTAGHLIDKLPVVFKYFEDA